MPDHSAVVTPPDERANEPLLAVRFAPHLLQAELEEPPVVLVRPPLRESDVGLGAVARQNGLEERRRQGDKLEPLGDDRWG